MKHLFLLLCPLLLVTRASAQAPLRSYYFMSFGIGPLFPRQPGKDFSISFPYTSASGSTGVSTSHRFTGSMGGKFYQHSWLGDIGRLEQVANHNCYEFAIGYLQDAPGDDDGYLKAGYGRVYNFKWIQLMPSVDIYFMMDQITLGNIDNRDSDITLMGRVIHSQWTEPSDDDCNPSTTTYNSGRLELDYVRNSLMAEPKLVASTILCRRFYLSIEGGWMFQLLQHDVIRLTEYDENDDTHTHGAGKVLLGRNGSLGGPYFALNVGVILKPWRRHPGHHVQSAPEARPKRGLF